MMANKYNIIPKPFGFLLSVFVLLLCSSKIRTSYGFQGTNSKDLHQILDLNSLLPTPFCNSFTKVVNRKSSLQVVHKHGPCNEFHQEKAGKSPTVAETVLDDEARVRYIQSKVAKKSKSDSNAATTAKGVKETNLPAKDGREMGSANYIVSVGLGTPKKQLSLVFDTGSDITWTQCKPCAGSCYTQQDPIFEPSLSSTYTNVSCKAAACESLLSATGISPDCVSSACVYGIQYGDSSFSVGLFAKERLTLSTDVFKNFLFGCGENNQGLFKGAAGLIGLGRNKLSLPSQTAFKYNKIFSYCLPSSPSSTGFLSFGQANVNGGSSNSVQFTPLSTAKELQDSSFYGLDIIGISVGGQKLSIAASVFTTSGAIIDSGTVITRLPPTAYATLRSAFRQRMSQYPRARAASILDTCYDFSKYTSVAIPKISFFFRGGVEVPVAAVGILYGRSVSQLCLAFAANGNDSDVAIFGNTQQKTLEVVYDGAGGRVGFSTGGCQ